MRRRRALAGLVVVAAAGTLAACLSAGGATHTTTTKPHHVTVVKHRRSPKPPNSFGVGLVMATWTESQGYTENFYTRTTTPGRVMQIEILYPSVKVRAPDLVPGAAPAYAFAPYPVIVFAHGYGVDPNTYRALLQSWAEAGYVVVAPFFPDTSIEAIEAQHGVDTEADMFNQPGDIAFVVSEIAEAGRGKAPPGAALLVGLVNSSRLILAGQSDGADTIAGLMYDKVYASTLASMAVQPKAVVLLSGSEWLRSEDVYSPPGGGGAPALVVQSLTDACNDPADSSLVYNMLTGPKWFLALEDATHLGPYMGYGVAADVVENVTVSFFDLAVGRGDVTAETLAQHGDQAGVSTISSAASVPLYPVPPYTPDACAPPGGSAA
jgi:hypothetical protein